MEEPINEYIAGQVLLSFRDFIKKRHGQEGVEQLSSAMDFEIMKITDEREYPANYAVDCMDYIHDAYGPEELFQMGRFSLQNIGSKRYFTLLLPPEKLLVNLMDSVPKVNSMVKLDIEYLENGAAITVSSSKLKEIHCNYWQGILQGVFDLTKTKGTIESDISKVSTDKKVIFTIKW